MEIEDVVNGVRDTLSVKRVFGEPYEKDGVTIIAAASVRGGAGGGKGVGQGPSDQGKGSGSGTGFGMNARPVGIYVIRGDKVRFQPAVDVNRIVLGAQLVAALAFITVRAIVKARAKAMRRGLR